MAAKIVTETLGEWQERSRKWLRSEKKKAIETALHEEKLRLSEYHITMDIADIMKVLEPYI